MNSKWHRIALFLLVVADLLFLFSINYPAVEINPYLLRDIQRSLAILNGHWVLVGSDFTSGSYAPGPFYYLTIAPVLAIFRTPFAVVAFSMFVKVASQLFFSVHFARFTKIPSSIIYLTMSSSAFLLERFIWVNNSSFIGPFLQVFAVLLLFYWQSHESKKTLSLLILLSLFAGGSLQAHFSMVFLIPIAFLVIHAKTRNTSTGAKESFIFIAGLLVTLTPFIIAFINDRYLHFFEGPIFFKSQLGAREFTKDGWRLFSKPWRVFHELNVFNLEVIIIFFYIVFKSLWIAWKKPFRRLTPIDQVFLFTGLMTLFFMAWILSGSYMRYFTIFFIPGLAYLTYDLYHIATKILKKPAVIFAVFFLACGLVRAQFSQFPKNLGLQGKCEACIYQMNLLCDYFNTNEISFEQFSKSTYEIFPSNSHGSLYYLHHCFERKTGMNPQATTKYLFVDSDEYRDPTQFSQVLSRLPKEIQPFYASPERFKKEIETPGFTLFSVEQDQANIPENRYSNLAYSYQFDPAFGEPLAIQSLREDDSSLYKARFCSSPVFCDLYVVAKIENGKLQVYFGSRLFQTKTELRPINAHIKNLRLEYLCDEKSITLDIVSTLGLVSEEQQNETFFTPLEFSAPAACKTWSLQTLKMDSVEVNANSSTPQVFKNESIPLEPL